MRSTLDNLALARGQLTNQEALRLAFRQLGVHESHPNPVCVEKSFDQNAGGYKIVFQCPSCGLKSDNDGLSQPCAGAKSVPEQLPPWGAWETD